MIKIRSLVYLAAVLIFAGGAHTFYAQEQKNQTTPNSPISANSPTSPLWGGLKKGNFAVGYKTFQKTDFSRATRSRTDFRGRPFEGERSNRVTFIMWYPATPEASARPLLYEDYSFVSAPAAPTEEQKNQFRSRFKTPRIAGGASEAKLDELLKTPTGAFYNAAPVNQKFPLLLGAGGLRSLGEYLASHGYVVVTVAGTAAQFGQIDSVNNLEFALNEMQNHPNVDMSKIAATGFSFGGGSATLLQMKTNNIDAVVSFDGVEAWTQARTDLLNLPFFNPDAATVPYLRFHDTERAAADVDFAALYDRAPYMNYMQIGYKDFGHRTSEAAILGHLVPNYDGGLKDTLQHFRMFAEYTRNFLDAHLKKDAAGVAYLKKSPEENGFAKDFLAVKRKDALPVRPPTSAEAMEIIDRDGIEAFLKINEELKKSLPKPLSSQVLTTLVQQYGIRNQPRPVAALAALLVEAYPELCTSYFNAAFTLARTGDSAAAEKYYEKFLEVEKTDTVTAAAVKDRMRRTATEALAALKKKA